MMPLERRREVVNIAAKLGAYIIENDSYGHLTGDKTPTIAALDPRNAASMCAGLPKRRAGPAHRIYAVSERDHGAAERSHARNFVD